MRFLLAVTGVVLGCGELTPHLCRGKVLLFFCDRGRFKVKPIIMPKLHGLSRIRSTVRGSGFRTALQGTPAKSFI